MKKKLLLVLLATVVLSLGTVLLTACTHEHTWGEWTVGKQATCTEEGERSHTCTSCDEIETEKIDALGHSFAAEWTHDGSKHWHVCSVCSAKGSEADHTMVDQECSVCGYEVYTQNLTYTLSEDEKSYSVSGENLTEADKIVRIPATHEGLPVATIGINAFRENQYIEKVFMPDSVTVIDVNAFRECDSLKSVAIPDSVTSIEMFAFYGCILLENLVIPDSVTTIGRQAFTSCINLTEFTLGKGVTSIGGYSFAACYFLEKVNYTGDLAAWCKIEFSDEDSNPLFCGNNLYINNALVNDITLPSGLTEIGSYVFAGCGFSGTLTVPNGYEKISEGAFYNCKNLTSVVIADSVTEIEESAFYSCSKLMNLNLGKGVISIGEEAFARCESLTTLVIPDSVEEIGYGAFTDCESLKSVTLGSGLEFIDGYAFEDCTALTKVDYTGEIADWMSIVFDNRRSTPVFYAHNLYIKGTLLEELVIPESITEIGEYTFAGCWSLAGTLTIPNHVTAIGDYAFRNCTGITGLNIGTSVETIGNYAFYSCTNLAEDLVIPEGVTRLGSGAFMATGIESIDLPDSLYYMGAEVFSECENITYTKYDNAYYVGTADNPYYCLEMQVSTDIDSCIIHESTKIIADEAFATNSNLKSITFPEGLRGIGREAFALCEGIESLVIPDSVICISQNAFFYASSLTSVTLGSGVEIIDPAAFYFTEKLVEICNHSNLNLEKGSSSYGYIACYAENIYTPTSGGSKLTETDDGFTFYNDGTKYYLMGYSGSESNLVLPESINGNTYEVYNWAFYKNNYLESVVIPDGVIALGDYAFNRCVNLKSVTLGNGVTTISKHAFSNCRLLTDIVIPDTVTAIAENAFSECIQLKSITIGSSVQEIGNSAFDSCDKLVEIYNLSSLNIVAGSNELGRVGANALNIYNQSVGSTNLTEVDGYIFYADNDNSYLIGYTGSEKELTLPANINGKSYAIYKNAFKGLPITSVVIPDNVTAIGVRAFENCSSLTSVTVGNGVTKIGVYAFNSCTSLKDLTLGSGLITIEEYVFANCAIVDLVIPNGVKTIEWYAFGECYSLKTISLPASLESISTTSFVYARELESIVVAEGNTKYKGTGNCLIDIASKKLLLGCKNSVIPTDGSVEIIEEFAFYTCIGLTSIVIPESVKAISSGAFSGIETLESVTFESPTGWIAIGELDDEMLEMDLSNPEKNADNIMDRYAYYYWVKDFKDNLWIFA